MSNLTAAIEMMLPSILNLEAGLVGTGGTGATAKAFHSWRYSFTSEVIQLPDFVTDAALVSVLYPGRNSDRLGIYHSQGGSLSQSLFVPISGLISIPCTNLNQLTLQAESDSSSGPGAWTVTIAACGFFPPPSP